MSRSAKFAVIPSFAQRRKFVSVIHYREASKKPDAHVQRRISSTTTNFVYNDEFRLQRRISSMASVHGALSWRQT
jgi:hypothetical protein